MYEQRGVKGGGATCQVSTLYGSRRGHTQHAQGITECEPAGG